MTAARAAAAATSSSRARSTRWQTYFYWLDDARAPAFARTIDIHRKPGYDPLELHLDRTRLPQIAIPLDASLVKGSHGAIDPGQSRTRRSSSHRGPTCLDADSLAMTDIAGVVVGRSAS